jgi:phage tail protein X
LSNLETAKEKILQLVLAGQPEFDALLARPEIRQLRQRISVSARLRPLARSEVKAYVTARITAAGGDVRGLFTRGALFRLWWFSGGVPRLVNAACDNALVTAYARGKRTIGWSEIGEAMRDLRRQVAWAPGRFKSIAAMMAAAAIGGGIVLGAMALFQGRWPMTVVAPPSAAPSAVVTVALAVATATAAAPTPEVTVTPDLAVVPASPDVAAAALEASPAPTVASAESPVPEVASPSPLASPEATVVTLPSPTKPVRETRPGSADDLVVRVHDGDTLTDLAVLYYGNASPRVLAMIRSANPWLDDPDVLWAGKSLRLPGAHAAAGAMPSPESGQ